MKLIIAEQDHVNSGCWISDTIYPKIDRKHIHIIYAAGEGEVSRHLCSNNHCVNPIHLVMGSIEENNQDKYDKQTLFDILKMQGHRDSIPHLDRTWKIFFRQLIEQGYTYDKLGVKIYTEQQEFQSILITKLRYKRIPIIELEA